MGERRLPKYARETPWYVAAGRDAPPPGGDMAEDEPATEYDMRHDRWEAYDAAGHLEAVAQARGSAAPAAVRSHAGATGRLRAQTAAYLLDATYDPATRATDADAAYAPAGDAPGRLAWEPVRAEAGAQPAPARGPAEYVPAPVDDYSVLDEEPGAPVRRIVFRPARES